MRRFPRRWWIAGAGVVVAIVGASFVWLAPGRARPALQQLRRSCRRARARSDVIALARRAGIDVGEVYVVDASRRTTAANAYVTGLGHTKRVVLYDTLLERFTPAQTRLVVAHELGHVKHHDLARGMLWVADRRAGRDVRRDCSSTERWSARAGAGPGHAGLAARVRAGARAGRVRRHGDLQPALARGRGGGGPRSRWS